MSFGPAMAEWAERRGAGAANREGWSMYGDP